MNLKLQPGHTLSGQKIIWSDADNPHIYISGRSGTGKSFLIKKLAAQAAAQRAFVLVLDYTSDFSEFIPPGGLCFQHIDVKSPVFHLNPLVSSPGEDHEASAQRLLAALHSVFAMGPKATLSLRHITMEYLSENGNPTLDGLLAYISRINKPDKSLESAKERLDLLTTLIHCGNQLISLDLETPGLTVLDCSRIYDPSLCKLLVELILQTLWTAHTPEQPPLVIVLDEAQRLHWGAGSMSAQILREGRKYEIAGWFSSQWIDHKDAISALGQAANQIHFQPESQHIDKLAKLICTRPKERPQYQALLQRLRRGEFVWQRENRQVVVVRVDS